MPESQDPKPGAAGKSPAKPKKPLPEITVKAAWCKSCGLCVEYCPRDVLKMEGEVPKVVDIERCTRCLQCELICPDFAIEVVRDEEKKP